MNIEQAERSDISKLSRHSSLRTLQRRIFAHTHGRSKSSVAPSSSFPPSRNVPTQAPPVPSSLAPQASRQSRLQLQPPPPRSSPSHLDTSEQLQPSLGRKTSLARRLSISSRAVVASINRSIKPQIPLPVNQATLSDRGNGEITVDPESHNLPPNKRLRKKMRTPNLGISVQRDAPDRNTGISPLSSPRTPHTPAGPHSPFNQSFAEGYDAHQHSPITAVPRHPSPKPNNKSAKSFFSNPIASRSTSKIPKQDSPVRNNPSASSAMSGGAMAQVYNLNRGMGSSPELTVSNIHSQDGSSITPGDDRSPSALHNPDNLMAAPNLPKKKSSKHKFTLGLGRKASIKDDENMIPESRNAAPQKSKIKRETRQDRSTRDKPSSTLRNQSVDRQTWEDPIPTPTFNAPPMTLPPQHNGRSVGTRAADGFGRAAKGLLGKLSTRSNDPKDAPDYKEQKAKAERDAVAAQQAHLTKSYNIVNLPLKEQTRRTRICKRLEECKDKTEFWLPAVAYRCIDYLNDKGMAHEGLYRVPGSEREIRQWIWRFDNELDIDLLAEEELYDVNTISSMFKAWLRDLPDEVFPKALQHRIAGSIPSISEQQGAPEILKHELSQLPPFNYYLLFAVTAHITMLLNSSKENKMTFHNLCVCFMPAMKMEMPCFQWLILDWKNCWRGCSTERDYLEAEYAAIENPDTEHEPVAPRSMPVQHFDKYPPPQLKSQDSQDSTRSRRDQSTDRGRPQHTVSAPHSSSQSPAPRPATSPIGPNPDGEGGLGSNDPHQSSRTKNRPAQLEPSTMSSSRRGSEPTTQPQFGPRANRNGNTRQDDVAEGQKDRLLDLPELSPMQPLSPFGNLDKQAQHP
ncbi:hypothetical protein BT63DRAFT_212779 [Microthyrium microscopicum]|uniref:Rho-GAP domain-containing protein n=1 Tax=Microthyrium microscopicum TaxID=703497 RepID=A0A6A6UHK8_9PEZI|nr:hypothetical protein BT63DRAFT_212779 [Microthyrium microscopicum]